MQPRKNMIDKLPDERLGEQGQKVPQDACKECQKPLGAGYLCDECDTLEVKS